MKRAVRWATLSVGLAGLVTMLSVTPSEATPPSGLTNITLARGTDTSHGTIPLRFGTDVVMAQITVNPGGSSGWHSSAVRSWKTRTATTDRIARHASSAAPAAALRRQAMNEGAPASFWPGELRGMRIRLRYGDLLASHISVFALKDA